MRALLLALLAALPFISCEAQAAPRDVRSSVAIVADTATVTVSCTPPPGNYDAFAFELRMAGDPVQTAVAPRSNCSAKFRVFRPDSLGQACVAATRGTKHGNESCASVAIHWPEEPIPDVGGVTVEIEIGAVEPPADTTVTDTGPPPVVIGSPEPDPSGYAELPRLWVNTEMTATSRTVAVTCGTLQAAVDSARDGDRIELPAGAECPPRSFTIRGQNSQPVIITTAGFQIPAGERVRPSTAGDLAVLTAPGVEPAIRTSGPVEGWRIMGLHVRPEEGRSLNYALIRIGTGSEATVDEQPRNVILDRIYTSAPDSIDLQRCITIEGRYIAVVNSWVSGCHYKGADAQAVISWNSVGPHALRNNYLEGSGENVMWGGADPKIPGAVACDLDVRGNHFRKPDSWYDRNGANPYTEKNLFELKNSCRVLVEGNVFEGNWQDGQTGFAIVLKSSNQSGRCYWCVTHDVTWRNNWIKNSPGGYSLHSLDDYSKGKVTADGDTLGGGIPMHNIVVVDNLHTGIMTYAGSRRTFQITGSQKLFIARNTMIEKGSVQAFMMDGKPSDSTQIVGNLLDRGTYGIFGSGKGEGTNAINHFLPNGTVTGNAIIGGLARLYPEGNYFPATAAEAPAGVGVDQDELMRRLEGVVVAP